MTISPESMESAVALLSPERCNASLRQSHLRLENWNRFWNRKRFLLEPCEAAREKFL